MHQFRRLRTRVVLWPLALPGRLAAAHAAPGGNRGHGHKSVCIAPLIAVRRGETHTTTTGENR
jgi:hypothetical protein